MKLVYNKEYVFHNNKKETNYKMISLKEFKTAQSKSIYIVNEVIKTSGTIKPLDVYDSVSSFLIEWNPAIEENNFNNKLIEKLIKDETNGK